MDVIPRCMIVAFTWIPVRFCQGSPRGFRAALLRNQLNQYHSVAVL